MVRDSKIDFLTLFLFIAIVAMAWFNLYSTSMAENPSYINFSTYHGKEAFFIMVAVGLGLLILFLDTKFLEFVSYFAYGASILALLAVLAMSKVTGGANSWFAIGGFKIQPTEFAKVATILALSKYMSRFNFSMKNRNDFAIAIGIVLLPMALVVLQNDAGSALVFLGFLFVFYREGLNPLVIIGGFLVLTISVVSLLFSTKAYFGAVIAVLIVLTIVVALVSFLLVFRRRFLGLHIAGLILLLAIPFTVDQLVKPYQSARFRILVATEAEINPPNKKDRDESLRAVHYNYLHSMVAIGSGGLTGKGFGKGTHIHGDFVPEEHTDYINCVLGEEHGFVGNVTLLVLFFLLIARCIYIAENSKSDYARLLGYGIGSIIAMHVIINVGMTIGLGPTIGIPLPFFSYGGSSMIAFTMMLFILMNHYSYRNNILTSG